MAARAVRPRLDMLTPCRGNNGSGVREHPTDEVLRTWRHGDADLAFDGLYRLARVPLHEPAAVGVR